MENSNITTFPKEKVQKEISSIQNSLSPREIVSELDRFVVGQNKAKKVRKIEKRNVIAGFAGSTADALSLIHI